MEQLDFSNNNIDLVCEDVGVFLTSVGVEKREALRIKLSLEEILLDYQERYGEEASFRVRCVKNFMTIKVELSVKGRVYNPLERDEEENAVYGILAGIGLAPSYSYRNGKNYVVFHPKKKPLSSTVKMGVAIGLAVLCGLLLNLLPAGFKSGVNTYVLSPVTDAFMGLITAVSVPLIFLSILGSICSMGNMETLGKIGSKTIRAILVCMTVISVFVTVLGSLFFPVKWGSGGAAGFSQILDLIYDVVPSNLFEPFVTGNTLQLIFISIIVGLAMLALSTRVSGVFKLVEQLDAIVQTIMSGISDTLPLLIFVLFTGTISGGDFGTLLESWKIFALILLLILAYYVLTVLFISARKKVSPRRLFKKIWKTFVIALATASSAAAFSTNVKTAQKKLGIDKKLVDFGIPLGQVLFDPSGFASLTVIELTMAEIYGIPITPTFLVIGLITNLLLAMATPPVPGGTIMAYTIAFAQLGIPMEGMGIVFVVDMLIDFPATACNVSGWQLLLTEVADSLDMLDKETIRK